MAVILKLKPKTAKRTLSRSSKAVEHSFDQKVEPSLAEEVEVSPSSQRETFIWWWANNRDAGRLLELIAFRSTLDYARLNRQPDRGRWSAHSHEWWLAELERGRKASQHRIGMRRLSRLLAVLDRAGYIERDQGRCQGTNMMFVRPTKRSKALLAAAKERNGKKSLSLPSGEVTGKLSGKVGGILGAKVGGKVGGKVNILQNLLTPALHNNPPLIGDAAMPVGLVDSGGRCKKVFSGETKVAAVDHLPEELSLPVNSELSNVVPHQEITAELGAMFQAAVEKAMGVVPPQLLVKEKAQLQHFAARVAQTGNSPVTVMSFCMEHWMAFSIQAAAAAGLSKQCRPEVPNIGFLLKNVVAACAAAAQNAKDKERDELRAKQRAAKAELQAAAKAQEPPPEEYRPATLAEILAIFDDTALGVDAKTLLAGFERRRRRRDFIRAAPTNASPK